jgi:hypothetical protein
MRPGGYQSQALGISVAGFGGPTRKRSALLVALRSSRVRHHELLGTPPMKPGPTSRPWVRWWGENRGPEDQCGHAGKAATWYSGLTLMGANDSIFPTGCSDTRNAHRPRSTRAVGPEFDINLINFHFKRGLHAHCPCARALQHALARNRRPDALLQLSSPQRRICTVKTSTTCTTTSYFERHAAIFMIDMPWNGLISQEDWDLAVSISSMWR